MTDAVICIDGPDLDDALDQLAARFHGAENIGVRAIARLGRPADKLLRRLPPEARALLELATLRGLDAAMSAASGTRRAIPDQKSWINTASAGASGALGGFAGMAGAVAELPISVTLMMRAVQAVAVDAGYDPDEAQARRDCLLAFAASGPLSREKGADLNFLAARVTLSGATVQTSIGLIAPRLAAVLGRKLATQAVPVLGAATAAATNLSYTAYYTDIARVVFGLRRLSEDSGRPFAELAEDLRHRTNPLTMGAT